MKVIKEASTKKDMTLEEAYGNENGDKSVDTFMEEEWPKISEVFALYSWLACIIYVINVKHDSTWTFQVGYY